MKENEFDKEFCNNNLDEIMQNTINNLKNILKTNTVVGDPIVIDDIKIIPVCKVNVGIIIGGGELSHNNKKIYKNYPITAGTGSGFNVIPIGFVIMQDKKVKFINIEMNTLESNFSKAVNMLLEKITNKKEIKDEKFNV